LRRECARGNAEKTREGVIRAGKAGKKVKKPAAVCGKGERTFGGSQRTSS